MERLIIIHNLIKSGTYPNVQKIQSYYCEKTGYEQVGVATIYRDISTLQVEFNAPIAYDPYKKGYYYTDGQWKLALNTISQDDIFICLQ